MDWYNLSASDNSSDVILSKGWERGSVRWWKRQAIGGSKNFEKKLNLSTDCCELCACVFVRSRV